MTTIINHYDLTLHEISESEIEATFASCTILNGISENTFKETFANSSHVFFIPSDLTAPAEKGAEDFAKCIGD